MELALSIADFNALLSQRQDDSLLKQLLQRLTSVNDPQDVRVLRASDGTEAGWQGWFIEPV